QGDTATRHDAFLDGGAGRVERVVDAVLALLDLHFGGAADADHGDAAGQLGQALLELVAVRVRGGFLDLRLDLADAALDVVGRAGAIDDGGVFLGDLDALGGAQHVEGYVLELDAELFRNHLAAGQDGDVLQHGLAAVAEARSLDGRDLEAAAQAVDHERGQGFALDVLGDDQQRTLGLNDALQDRQDGLQVGQLLFVQQDDRVLEGGGHLLGIGHEIGREIAAVELHALDHVELGLGGLGFLDGDDTLIAHLLHRLGDHVADFLLAIGRDGADLGDFGGGGDVLGGGAQAFHDLGHGQVDAALQVHRVEAGGDGLDALDDDGLTQHGGGGGAVAGDVIGLGGDRAQ